MNNRDKNFTPAKMQRLMAELEASIDRYLAEIMRFVDFSSRLIPGGKAMQTKFDKSLTDRLRASGGVVPAGPGEQV